MATAAREGCRVAVIDGNSNADVTTRIDSILAGASISGAVLTLTPADCTTVRSSDASNTISLKLEVDYGKVSWLSSPYFLKTAKVSTSATMSSERP